MLVHLLDKKAFVNSYCTFWDVFCLCVTYGLGKSRNFSSMKRDAKFAVNRKVHGSS